MNDERRNYLLRVGQAFLVIFSLVAGLASIVAASGWYSVNFTYALFAIILFCLILSAWILRKRLIPAVKFENKKVSIEVLDSIDGIEKKIGLIGIKDTGKTTFIEKCMNVPHSNTKTETPEAYIIRKVGPDRELKFNAVIDSKGDAFHQQISVIEKSDILAVFIDHSSADLEKVESGTSRFSEHLSFFTNLLSYLKSRREKMPEIFVVNNKFDLRVGLPNIKDLQEYYRKAIDSSGISSQSVKFIYLENYSNLDYDKLQNLRRLLGIS